MIENRNDRRNRHGLVQRPRAYDRWLWAMVLLAVVVRMPGVARPLLGNFATKNVAYAMIARNWATGEAPAWQPTLDVLVNGEPGLHLLEIPLAAYAAGALWQWFGGTLDVWGRAVSIACSAAAVAWLYVFVRRLHGRLAASGAAATLALAPVSIVYGQSFMLEASVVLLSIGALDCADRFALWRGWWWLPVSGVLFCLLVLTKIYMGVLLAPLLWLVWRGDGRPEASPAGETAARARRLRLLVAAAVWGLALLPAGLWYLHVRAISAADSPQAEHVFYSLRDSQAAHAWPPRLLTEADFYRQLLDDAASVLLTPVGFALLLLGMCRQEARRHIPWLAAMASLVLIMPGKFYAMNYYYLVILPPLAVLAGLGFDRAAGASPSARRAVVGVLLVASLAFSLRYAVKPAFVTPAEDRSVLQAAAACRELVPEGEPVATLHGTTFDLLYYCRRRGWVMPPRALALPKAVAAAERQGARFLVVANLSGLPEESRAWLGQLTLAAQGDDFAVYSLEDERPLP